MALTMDGTIQFLYCLDNHISRVNVCLFAFSGVFAMIHHVNHPRKSS